MFCYPKLAGGTALATLMLAQTAAAEITPAQVWDDLRGYMQGYGYTVTAETVSDGDVLTLTDLTTTIPIPEDDVTVVMVMPELTLSATGDGAVDVAWPAEMPITFDIAEGDEQISATLLYETTDLEATVSGEPGATGWAYSASSARISLADLVVEGVSLPREVVRGEILLDGLVGTSQMTTGTLRDIAQEMKIGALSYDFAGRDPDNTDNTLLFQGGMTDLAYTGTGTLPVDMDSDDPMAVMAVMDVNGSFSYSGGSAQFNGVEDGEAASFASSSEGGSMGVSLAPEAWNFDFLVNGYDVQVQGGDLPFPVSLSAGELGGNFAMPVARSEAPQDIAAGLTLGDFQMNDLIWNIFDPAGQLPRDPATVQIDLTGKVRMLYDLFDPAQAEALEMAEVPAELHELTLNTLVVDAIGAVLTATGAFTFDNSDLQTFDGMPRPQGALTAELRGANALIDKLVAMGLLPEEQAMGARMMMGMFAVNQGDDTLSSTLEVNEQGHVIANGQRIQ
ncbi:DUF2125 domain-containing protein [Marinovum algicola]|uniref:DUF2125 domain-containing protein n=1 Tax=Marinovum algicola TaxID=42444 RepID=UPI0024BAFCC2|nr:DUF2125 domain-containing protein [Marinovum algicola]